MKCNQRRLGEEKKERKSQGGVILALKPSYLE